MKSINLLAVGFVFSALSSYSAASWQTHCATVDKLLMWPSGSDRYGIRVSVNPKPNACSGFWIPHSGNNKDYVVSALMAAKLSESTVCIQFSPDQTQQDGNCRLNMLELR